MFALIIFNSYSAFITSVLSVEVSDIKSIEDLLASDYHLGYIKNSQDDVYLQVCFLQCEVPIYVLKVRVWFSL